MPGGCSRFGRCCYLIIVLSSHLFGESWAPGLSRSHLNSAIELGCRDRSSLGHRLHRFLAIAQWFDERMEKIAKDVYAQVSLLKH